MEPCMGAYQTRHENRGRGTEQRRFDNQNYVLPPSNASSKKHRKAGKSEGEQMKKTGGKPELFRDPERATMNTHSFLNFRLVSPGIITGMDSPLRIVGRSCDDFDVMASGG